LRAAKRENKIVSHYAVLLNIGRKRRNTLPPHDWGQPRDAKNHTHKNTSLHTGADAPRSGDCAWMPQSLRLRLPLREGADDTAAEEDEEVEEEAFGDETFDSEKDERDAARAADDAVEGAGEAAAANAGEDMAAVPEVATWPGAPALLASWSSTRDRRARDTVRDDGDSGCCGAIMPIVLLSRADANAGAGGP
jgi:hypothetical protein